MSKMSDLHASTAADRADEAERELAELQAEVRSLRMTGAGPILFSANAMHTMDVLRDWFGRELASRSLRIAREDGRTTIEGSDVMAASGQIRTTLPGETSEPARGFCRGGP